MCMYVGVEYSRIYEAVYNIFIVPVMALCVLVLTSLMTTANTCRELAMCVLRNCTELGGPDTCMDSPPVEIYSTHTRASIHSNH